MFVWRLIILISVIYGCSPRAEQSEFDLINDAEARRAIELGLNNAGGLDKWLKIKELSFEKISILLLEDGTIEDSTTQSIYFRFYPEFSADISWIKNSSAHRVQYESETTYYSIDDSVSAINEKRHHSLVMSALYTVAMPYKLLDDGTSLAYVEEKELEGVSVDVIKADYDAGSNPNHSSDEGWWYYFEMKSGRFIGSMVHHTPTYAFIENTSFEEVEGLKFPSRRLSFRVDSLGNKQFLRGEFFYSDFSASFK